MINFIFARTFFLIASNQILKNNAILIIHGQIFQRKDSVQFDRFQFLKITSLMAETIKNNFPKQHVYKQITEFHNNLFILFYFPCKNDP